MRPPSRAPCRAEQRSTRVAFFIAGFGMAAWAPLVPYAKARTGLDDGALGLLLLCLGVGSIIAMPAAGILTARLGCRRVLVAASLLNCLTLPLLAILPGSLSVALVLFAFGAGVGMVDCAVNIQAVIVERASERPMMSGFHGLFSVGGILGAAGMSTLLSLGVSPFLSTVCVVALIIAALLMAAPHFLAYGDQQSGPAFAIPRGAVLFIGTVCFIVFLTEGAMLDWSAVFLHDLRGLSPSLSGLGYAAFATTMTLGRLTGDRVVRRFGPVTIVVVGATCAAAGLVLATLHGSSGIALSGFALVGLGCSNVAPIMYSQVGRQKSMATSAAVPAITTMGYSGILVGPALIGFLAHQTSLSAAFLFVGAALLCVAASTPGLLAQR